MAASQVVPTSWKNRLGQRMALADADARASFPPRLRQTGGETSIAPTHRMILETPCILASKNYIKFQRTLHFNLASRLFFMISGVV